MITFLYKVILRWCPREFRDRFGAEMVETAQALDAAPQRRRIRALGDAAATVIDLRSELHPRPALRQRLTGTGCDLKVGARRLWREPRFSVFVSGTLALAIGATATLFGLADRLVFRGPEQIRDAGRMMRVQLLAQPPDGRPVTISEMGHVLFAAIRDRAANIDGAASFAPARATMGRAPATRPLHLVYASPEYFDLLGALPTRGRFFGEGNRNTAAAGTPAVISYALWQGDFAAGDDVVGRPLVIDGNEYTVIGVAPRGFTGAEVAPVDAWIPISVLNPQVTRLWETAWNAQWLNTIVRLPTGVTRAQAGESLTVAFRQAYNGPSAVMRNASLEVVPLTVSRDRDQASDTRVVQWLFVVAGLVFLVACANIMSLLLARSASRRREIGVSLALGASRAVIVRGLVIEAGLLACLGTGLGLVLAGVLGRLARQSFFDAVQWTSAPVNERVLLVSAILAFVTTILTGWLPARAATRANPIGALHGAVRDSAVRPGRVRAMLMVVQTTASVVLLVGAGLFVRSLWNAHAVNLGVDGEHVIVGEVFRDALSAFPAGPARDAERQRRRIMLRESMATLRALPGVERASIAVGMPFGFTFTFPMSVPGVAPANASRHSISAVTSDYFATVGTPIVEGRAFLPSDRAGSEPVVIVSAQMAHETWPGGSALGSCLIVAPPGPCATVVGVAADTHRSRLRETPMAHVYLPLGQESGFGGEVLLVRAERGLPEVAAAVQRQVIALDSSITQVRTETLQARIDPEFRSWRLGSVVFCFAGGLALIIAAVGLFSVLSYVIAARRHEIGVRFALGASTLQVQRAVFRTSLAMALAGIAAGLCLSFGLSPLLQPWLFDVSARDPLVFAIVAGVLAATAILSSIAPALRASRLDPLEVLRN